ncbi:MAG: hypothetical protein KJ709_06655 [Nanoarchaeota archaeon]|nr:hypothetical protein [Nanoarchaeota archaeon]
MEDFQRYRDEAEKALFIADHMLTVTYPLVQDTKILLSVLLNIHKGLKLAVMSILSHELIFKRIPAYPQDFGSQLELFEARATRRYDITPEYIQLIRKINDVVEMHKTSPMEFTRKDKFVICSDNYRLSSISKDQLKDHLSKAKLFIGEMKHIVGKHERIFR